jgi:hypothetical protein
MLKLIEQMMIDLDLKGFNDAKNRMVQENRPLAPFLHFFILSIAFFANSVFTRSS